MPCYALLFPVEPPAESTVLKLRVREASERGPPGDPAQAGGVTPWWNGEVVLKLPNIKDL